MKTALLSRVGVGAVLTAALLGCARPSAGADDRAGLMLVDAAPRLLFLPCEGEEVDTVSVWSNSDGDRVVLEPDDDEILWSIERPAFDEDGTFAEKIDLPDGWWLGDTQVEIETSDSTAIVIVTGVETLEDDQVWSSSLLMPPEEFDRRAANSC